MYEHIQNPTSMYVYAQRIIKGFCLAQHAPRYRTRRSVVPRTGCAKKGHRSRACTLPSQQCPRKPPKPGPVLLGVCIYYHLWSFPHGAVHVCMLAVSCGRLASCIWGHADDGEACNSTRFRAERAKQLAGIYSLSEKRPGCGALLPKPNIVFTVSFPTCQKPTLLLGIKRGPCDDMTARSESKQK